MSKSVLIIGNGIVGHNLREEFRELHPEVLTSSSQKKTQAQAIIMTLLLYAYQQIIRGKKTRVILRKCVTLYWRMMRGYMLSNRLSFRVQPRC